MSDMPRITYVLELRSLTETWRPEPWMRLRAVLKQLKRGYGFECVRCEEVRRDSDKTNANAP